MKVFIQEQWFSIGIILALRAYLAFLVVYAAYGDVFSCCYEDRWVLGASSGKRPEVMLGII